MGSRPIKLRIVFAAVFCSACAVAAPSEARVFEQVASGQPAWRTRGPSSELLVLPNGFVVRHGSSLYRFRWDPAMRLESLVPERPLPTSSYALSVPGGTARLLPHAERLRATAGDRRLSVVYYFGSRGLEFDIEVEPGPRPPVIRLESADGDLSLDGNGHLAVSGESISLGPVAYTMGPDGNGRPIPVAYRLEDPRHAVLVIGKRDPRERVVVDPVMTWASYFAGSGDEAPVAIREMPDGSVLFAGNTDSIDLPLGVSLNTLLTAPSGVRLYSQCFVARVLPADRRIRFVSYLGGSSLTACTAMDVDRSGRILLAGVTRGSPNFATSGAQYSWPKYATEGFLARISEDGKTLEYSTYLRLDPADNSLYMRAGPGETAYLGVSCSNRCADMPDIAGGYQATPATVVLLRYDIAAKRFDQKTYFGSSESLAGIELAPAGAVYIFGSTQSQTLPLQGAFQTTPPAWSAGFVAALSPDLRTLLFSSYLGGQNLHTAIESVLPNPDGTVWLNGTAYPNSIPGLQPARPFWLDTDRAPFAVLVSPGTAGFRKGFFAAGYGLTDYLGHVSPVVLADGRYCLATDGPSDRSSPGGAALGSAGPVPLLGCLNDAGNDFQMLTPTGTAAQPLDTVLVAPSAKGGIWSLQLHGRGGFGDVIPFEFKSAAFQPFRPNTYSDSDDLILRYFDLNTPNPVLTNPQPLRFIDLQLNTISSVDLSGQNFALGMKLDVDGTRFPLAVTSPSAATLTYVSPSVVTSTELRLNLRAGDYTGRLVIPTQPEPAVSEPFPVVVANMAPALEPFIRSNDPRMFTVSAPVYDSSQVLWNGTPVPLTKAAGGAYEVRIPVELSPPGAGVLTLINPRPGGGSQRQNILIPGGSGTPDWPGAPTVVRMPVDFFQVDRSRKLLYTIATTAGAADWALSSYALPSGSQLQKLLIPRNGASAAVDLKLTADGSYLYIADSLLRVMRFRTDAFKQDLQFSIPKDAPSGGHETRHSVRVLEGEPESLLVVTPGGRMILYDRDQPRPYTSDDFPSLAVTRMDPLLVTSNYVYASEQADVYHPVPCLVRYPIDGLGFRPAEDLCNLGTDWRKYPEMERYAGTLVLESGSEAYGVRDRPDSFGAMRLYSSFDPSRDLVATAAAMSFDFSTGTGTYRIVVSRLSTREPIGHFPPVGAISYPTSLVFLDDDTMVYLEQSLGLGSVVIVPQWQAAIERYP